MEATVPENHPSEAQVRQGWCLGNGTKAAWRLPCGGHCGSENEGQKRMYIELVCLKQKVLWSAKHAVPLP